ncbi:MAG: hypothetical protein IEMM0008_0604 [bacterium]|nr:MAG: hypothetical protein IEMM0008_0604 [bacterium]
MKVQYQDEVLHELEGLSDEQTVRLIQVIRRFKASLISQRDQDFSLEEEFEEWDDLSDQALHNFESRLE